MQYYTKSTELFHYGVPGMKWGVRNKSVTNASSKPSAKSHGDDILEIRAMKKTTTTGYNSFDQKSSRKLQKAQKKWDKAYQKNYVKAYNSAADYANEVLIPKINAKYSKIIKTQDWSKDPNYERYMNEYEREFNKIKDKKIVELIGERPT